MNNIDIELGCIEANLRALIAEGEEKHRSEIALLKIRRDFLFELL